MSCLFHLLSLPLTPLQIYTVYMLTYMYASIHTCICVYVYACVYIHLHTIEREEGREERREEGEDALESIL